MKIYLGKDNNFNFKDVNHNSIGPDGLSDDSAYGWYLCQMKLDYPPESANDFYVVEHTNRGFFEHDLGELFPIINFILKCSEQKVQLKSDNKFEFLCKLTCGQMSEMGWSIEDEDDNTVIELYVNVSDKEIAAKNCIYNLFDDSWQFDFDETLIDLFRNNFISTEAFNNCRHR